MDDNDRQFLQDMLRDSMTLEDQQEHGQAFDKLARGVESLFNKLAGATQREKARKLFGQYVSNEEVWKSFVINARGVESFGEDFHYSTPKQQNIPLTQVTQSFNQSVSMKDKNLAAQNLADLVLLIRNKRFHGHPAFSGRNIRVAIGASHLLAVLRACLHQEMIDSEKMQNESAVDNTSHLKP